MAKQTKPVSHTLLLLGALIVCADLRAAVTTERVFAQQAFTAQDSILVMDASNEVVFGWRADVPRTPASVVKVLTSWLALERWGSDHRFTTDFYEHDNQLWVKGLGDPMLISEELDSVAAELRRALPELPSVINLDSSLFANPSIPGRGKTDDPYNAPLSAVAANFNTVSLKLENGQVASGEPQTPLTSTAKQLAKGQALRAKASRINLRNAELAQQQVGELLAAKLGKAATININQRVPAAARIIYTHRNSRPLAEVVRGALEYSNNFIANQLFLLLGDASVAGQSPSVLDFDRAQEQVADELEGTFGWQQASVVDGAGLSRDNRLSANQIAELLIKFEPWRHLLKRYPLTAKEGVSVSALAKSGTLTGVHALAGFLTVNGEQYRFVFLFDRAMPINYRERLLQRLADQLAE